MERPRIRWNILHKSNARTEDKPSKYCGTFRYVNSIRKSISKYTQHTYTLHMHINVQCILLCECGRLCLCVCVCTPIAMYGDGDGDGLNRFYCRCTMQTTQKRKQSERYHGCRKCQNSQTRAKLHIFFHFTSLVT